MRYKVNLDVDVLERHLMSVLDFLGKIREPILLRNKTGSPIAILMAWREDDTINQ